MPVVLLPNGLKSWDTVSITKAGDSYLRSLLMLGARALLAAAKNKTDAISRWAVALAERRGYWKGGGGHRREERAHGLGGAAKGRGLCTAGLTNTADQEEHPLNRSQCC